jgi:hypothetical protein
MFKLIGIFVVVSVLVLSYDSFKRWFVGDSSPQETVTEVRRKVGEVLIGDHARSHQGRGTDIKPIDPAAPSQSNGIPLDTSEMVREMMKK